VHRRSPHRNYRFPDDYQFPFLQWLKEVELSFNLTQTSLNTDVSLKVTKTKSGDSPPLILQPYISEHGKQTASVGPFPAIPSKKEPNTTRVDATQLSLRVSASTPQALTNATFSTTGDRVLVGGFGRTAHLLDVRTLEESVVLRGHQNVIWTLALSPDGNTAVTGSEDKTLRFWNLKTGQEIQRIRADGIFSCARYSPDGNTVFATNWDGKVRIIEIPNFKVKASIECGQPTLDISVFQDGQHFVVGTPSGEILLYNIETEQAEKRFVGHTTTVHSVAVFRDGKHFLSASHDHTLRLWNVATGKCVSVFRGHTAAVHEVRLAANERQFVSCSADGTVRLWDVTSVTPRASSTARKEIRGISISPQGSTVAAVSLDGKIQIHALERPK
jgi:WD40 repeat protein